MSFTFDNKKRGATRAITYPAKVPFAFTSSTGLGANEVYTSDWSDVVDFNSARGMVYLSGSAGTGSEAIISGSFAVQQSFDTGSGVETSSIYFVSNGVAVIFDETLYARYARLQFTNDGASGSAFYTGSFIVQGYSIA